MSTSSRQRSTALLSRLRIARQQRDAGFTLIELLIVIIIIGILAAIAIPVFLNQRNKGYDATAKSDLNGMQLAEESYLTDNDSYTATTSDLVSEGFKASTGDTDSVKGFSSDASYCLKAVSRTGTAWYLGSTSGGPTTTACTTS
jgi:type IV pilus assembly protein PilA